MPFYAGLDTAADLSEHANQMNPNNWRYWRVRSGNAAVDVPANIALVPFNCCRTLCTCCVCVVGSALLTLLGTFCVGILSFLLLVGQRVHPSINVCLETRFAHKSPAAAIGLWVLSGYTIVLLQQYHLIAVSSVSVPWLVPFGLILLGLFCIFASISGFCGLAKPCCACLFIISLMIILSCLVAASVLVGRNQRFIEESVRNSTEMDMDNYSGNNKSAWDGEMNFIQQNIHCCGLNNFTDWAASPWGMNHSSKIEIVVPWSCCNKTGGCGGDAIDAEAHPDWIYQDGCTIKMEHWIHKHLTIILWSTVALCVVLVYGIISTCLHICSKSETSHQHHRR